MKNLLLFEKYNINEKSINRNVETEEIMSFAK